MASQELDNAICSVINLFKKLVGALNFLTKFKNMILKRLSSFFHSEINEHI